MLKKETQQRAVEKLKQSSFEETTQRYAAVANHEPLVGQFHCQPETRCYPGRVHGPNTDSFPGYVLGLFVYPASMSGSRLQFLLQNSKTKRFPLSYFTV